MKSVFDKVCSVYCTSCAVCIVQVVPCVLYKVGSLYCTRWAVCIVQGGQQGESRIFYRQLFPSASPMLSAFGSVKVKCIENINFFEFEVTFLYF